MVIVKADVLFFFFFFITGHNVMLNFQRNTKIKDFKKWINYRKPLTNCPVQLSDRSYLPPYYPLLFPYAGPFCDLTDISSLFHTCTATMNLSRYYPEGLYSRMQISEPVGQDIKQTLPCQLPCTKSV